VQTHTGHSTAFNMYSRCDLWPHINWWARTRDGLSLRQVWL